jgi:hypothetical protein
VTRVRLSIARAHLAVLPRVPRPQLQHFATSLPEALPPLYPDTRSVEIPNSSLLLIATRDFGTFGTKVSTSYPPICRNAEIPTRRQRRSHNETSRLFGVSDFANPDAKLSVLQPTIPRNTEFRCTSPITGSHKSFCPFGTSPFATSRISRQGF